MEKSGHLLVTNQFAGALPLGHRLCLKLGCILPDLLVHTYLVGHTWEASRERVEAWMHSLARYGQGCCLSYLKLGCILHYVEDFFTLPHNSVFSGSLAEHLQYEHAFTRYLKEQELWSAFFKNEEPVPAELIVTYLRWLHSHYEAEAPGYENDSRYITQAAALVAHSYYGIFRRNRQLAGAEERNARAAYPD